MKQTAFYTGSYDDIHECLDHDKTKTPFDFNDRVQLAENLHLLDARFTQGLARIPTPARGTILHPRHQRNTVTGEEQALVSVDGYGILALNLAHLRHIPKQTPSHEEAHDTRPQENPAQRSAMGAEVRH